MIKPISPRIVVNDTRSPTTVLMTKALSPTGGVSSPIASSITTSTPIQIGSSPTAFDIGSRIGSAISMMPTGSRKHPRMRSPS